MCTRPNSSTPLALTYVVRHSRQSKPVQTRNFFEQCNDKPPYHAPPPADRARCQHNHKENLRRHDPFSRRLWSSSREQSRGGRISRSFAPLGSLFRLWRCRALTKCGSGRGSWRRSVRAWAVAVPVHDPGDGGRRHFLWWC